MISRFITRSDPSQPTVPLLCYYCVITVSLCRFSLASLLQMGFLHHMEEVNGAALLSAWLRSSCNVYASLICAVALRVCSDKTWQKKRRKI